MWNLVNFLVQIIWHYLFTGKSLYLQDQNIFYSIEIYRPCIYRKIPVNTGKMCFIAFVLKTTGSCKIFLYLQDPVITEPCIFIALGSGQHSLVRLCGDAPTVSITIKNAILGTALGRDSFCWLSKLSLLWYTLVVRHEHERGCLTMALKWDGTVQYGAEQDLSFNVM
jgi:hypothetical protein